MVVGIDPAKFLIQGHVAQALELARDIAASESGQARRIASALTAEAVIKLQRSEEAERFMDAAGGRDTGSEAGRYAARLHAIHLMAAGEAHQASEYIESIVPALLVDRGPDGWVASLMHLGLISRLRSPGVLSCHL